MIPHRNPRRVGPRPRDVDQIVGLLALAIGAAVGFLALMGWLT